MTFKASRFAIFGATSEIASAVARRLAEQGASLVLVGRDKADLDASGRDLKVRGAHEVHIREADFSQTRDLTAVVDAVWQDLGRVDAAFVAFGVMPDQIEAEGNQRVAEQSLIVNFVSPVLLCNALARKFAVQKSGTIAVITSVAGDRGRQSNFMYGAAKGGLQRYVEGLRHRLFAKNVDVLDIRPGMVRTKMTAHLEQSGLLWADADQVATDIVLALGKRRRVVYTPWFWRFVMLGVRNLPSSLFNRSSL